ncbi:MAG: hypothetical protein MUE44_07525 [Oscillatoriaceae cyanobacterium Prado104]|jgi:hypothetical protein|nr:hypothetical protein [Oscillatoriaceae cyanobacterium Prado104]
MSKKLLFGAVFAGVFTAWTIALLSNSVLAKTQISIAEIHWLDYTAKDRWQSIELIVPERDTLKRADRQKLRLYELHLAKVFEISHFLCQRDRAAAGYNWSYQAVNGNIEIGRYKISCRLARETAATYGLGKPETTAIRRNFKLPNGRDAVAVEKYAIPTLNITKNRFLQWRDFAKQLTPIENSGTQPANTSFPANNIFKQIKGKTRVPVFLPSRLSLSGNEQLDFDVQAGSHGYIVRMYLGKGCRTRDCYFGSIEAKRDEAFSPPSRLPRDTYRSIELEGGMRAIYFSKCGVYCNRFVEWQRLGVLYRVTLKNGSQQEVVQIANSAIRAGQR